MAVNFDVQRDVRIEARRHGDAYRLLTQGLAAFGRRELEMVGVSEAHIKNAASVINCLADYTVREREIAPGELFGGAMGSAHVVVRLMELRAQPGTDEVVGGFFGTAARPRKAGPLRVVGPEEGSPLDAPPQVALHTVMLARAESWLEQDPDSTRARSELERSIELFPGDPAKRVAPSFGGAVYNNQNHLAYARLATLVDEAAGQGLYEDALRRSAEFEAAELGCDPEDLAALDRPSVEAAIAEVLTRNLDGQHALQPVTPGVAMVRSPLWLRGEDENVVRGAALVPAGLVGLYYDGPGAQALSQRSWLRALVADAVLRHAREPAKLLWPAREAKKLWADPDAPRTAMPIGYLPPHGVVSLMLADLARRACAGLTERECRASYGLVDDPAARESGDEKLQQFADSTEAAWYQAALGGPV